METVLYLTRLAFFLPLAFIFVPLVSLFEWLGHDRLVPFYGVLYVTWVEFYGDFIA